MEWLDLQRNLNYMGDVDHLIPKLYGTGWEQCRHGGGREATLMRAMTHCGTRVLESSWSEYLRRWCRSVGALRDEHRAAGGDGLVGNILFALFVFWVVTCYAAMCWLA